MNDYLTHLKLDINKNKLLLESDFTHFVGLSIPNAGDSPFANMPEWEFGRVNNPMDGSEVKKLKTYFQDLFGVKILPRFLKQQANFEIPMHKDYGTIACINILLTDERSPITFEDIGDVDYECALVNVAERHMVKPHPEERLLLKLSVFDKTYEECYACLPDSLKL